MNGQADREWRQLTDDWQQGGEAATDVPGDIRRRVQRFGLGLYALTALELGALGFVLFLLSRRAWLQPEPLQITTAVTLWILGLVAMGFNFWNRRGTWRPATHTTWAFVELSRERCRRRLRGVRFAWGLLAAEVVLFLPWIAWVIASNPEKRARIPEVYLSSYGFLAGMVLAAILGLLWYRGYTMRELERWEELRRELTE